MSMPSIQKQLAQKQLEKFCATHIPIGMQEQIKIDYNIVKNIVTLIEKRPQWNDNTAPWTELPIAHIAYDKVLVTWQLYWIRNGRKELYVDLTPQKDLQKCIDEIGTDPLATFWG